MPDIANRAPPDNPPTHADMHSGQDAHAELFPPANTMLP